METKTIKKTIPTKFGIYEFSFSPLEDHYIVGFDECLQGYRMYNFLSTSLGLKALQKLSLNYEMAPSELMIDVSHDGRTRKAYHPKLCLEALRYCQNPKSKKSYKGKGFADASQIISILISREVVAWDAHWRQLAAPQPPPLSPVY